MSRDRRLNVNVLPSCDIRGERLLNRRDYVLDRDRRGLTRVDGSLPVSAYERESEAQRYDVDQAVSANSLQTISPRWQASNSGSSAGGKERHFSVTVRFSS